MRRAFDSFRCLLRQTEAGLSDSCPDMAKAVNTWQFAIKALKKAQIAGRSQMFSMFSFLRFEAAGPKLDAGTLQYVTQIEACRCLQ